jgi:hypothetical protein
MKKMGEKRQDKRQVTVGRRVREKYETRLSKQLVVGRIQGTVR